MNKFSKIACIVIVLCLIFSCSEQDVFSQCIECNGIVQVCEGDDDGNGGTITRNDLEQGLADGTYSQSCKLVYN